MAIDGLTLTAVVIALVIAGVLVRICTLHENGCSGANEYLAQKREQDRQDNQGD